MAEGDALDRNPRYRRHPNFQSRFLPGEREISVYLPPQYLSEPARRFPVLYLHDGQNLFDPRTSFVPGSTWRANTTADFTNQRGLSEPLILVGIPNMGIRRIAEYTPGRDSKLGGGDGYRYGCMLVEELKPFIDSTYRTQPSTTHTGIGGSSLGGLISLYIGLHWPHIFGRLAVLSPSVWWDHRSILGTVTEATPKQRPRIWLDMGTDEGTRHVRDTDLLHTLLLRRGWSEHRDIEYRKFPGAGHNEPAWAARFDQVLHFLFPPR